MNRWRLDHGSWLLLSFALVAVPALALAPGAVRVVVAVLLAGVVPGYAVVRPIGLRDPAIVVVSSVAASLAITALSSLALGYLMVWSWPSCAAVLAAITAGGAVAHGAGVGR